ncbi:glycosyltransferase family 2 protein [Microbulbifer sp. ARAS458-1]|uniref:glycosyltransferase family 2 protein n=1 Tax=Microbulbifer sp. ARAS458-1 TaxID=3140242 RepID=UPI003877F49A
MKTDDHSSLTTAATSTGTARIFVAIVSHRHARNVAEDLRPHRWRKSSGKIFPIILSNVPDTALLNYCDRHNLPLIENITQQGFGANNNKIYRHAKENLGLKEDDYFFCINPDIITSAADIIQLSEIMKANQYTVAAPNLLKPDGTPDDNIRSFPTLKDIAYRYFFNSKKSNVEKRIRHGNEVTDWASGAYLCFRASTYEEIQGFDEKYFMYYEDADICRRAGLVEQPTYYIPSVKATHIGNRKSRGLPTKQLVYHVTSAIRFTLANSK